MDPLKLLSRSTGLRKGKPQVHHNTPSSGQNAQTQLFPFVAETAENSRKRKHGQAMPSTLDDQRGGLDFFSGSCKLEAKHERSAEQHVDESGVHSEDQDGSEREEMAQSNAPDIPKMSDEDVRVTLMQHKLRVTLLNPTSSQARHKRKGKSGGEGKAGRPALYPQPLTSFKDMQQRFGISKTLARNLDDQGYTMPTEVQLGALPLLLDKPSKYLPPGSEASLIAAGSEIGTDLLTVAPTGSGKTLTFMIPLLHRIQSGRRRDRHSSRKISGIVLAPTKELVGQITNEGKKLVKRTGIRVTQLRKGMRLSPSVTSQQQVNDEGDLTDARGDMTAVRTDVLISTPGLLHSILSDAHTSAQFALSDVRDFVLDEADVLLDPLFREQTLGVWSRLSHCKMNVSLWSATMGSNIEELAISTIIDRRDRLRLQGFQEANEAPLIRLIVGLKDSAVPSVQHKLVYGATEQGKLMGLRQVLHPASTPQGAGPPLLPPFLIFTQTIERAVALHSELLYDIPAEAGGITRIAVLHADLSDAARDSVMRRFRKGEIWVLITTDLISRGVDFRGVNGVVNYDIPTSSAAYVHRVGRTGRAGREGGVAITLYSREDIPYLKHVANVVAMAQRQGGASAREPGLQQWLLDALPKLSKQEKHRFKKRGIESRTARGRDNDPKAARRARISSKAGFVRQTENNRKGAVLGSQRRAQLEAKSDAGDVGDETDFDGFD